jgi:hypothetical protein
MLNETESSARDEEIVDHEISLALWACIRPSRRNKKLGQFKRLQLKTLSEDC